MKKYLVVIKQKGEGCDYTIGCGIDVLTLQAVDVNQVGNALKNLIAERYNSDDLRLDSIKIVECEKEYNVDVEAWYKELDTFRQQEIDALNKKNELAEFERLKKKYNL